MRRSTYLYYQSHHKATAHTITEHDKLLANTKQLRDTVIRDLYNLVKKYDHATIEDIGYKELAVYKITADFRVNPEAQFYHQTHFLYKLVDSYVLIDYHYFDDTDDTETAFTSDVLEEFLEERNCVYEQQLFKWRFYRNKKDRIENKKIYLNDNRNQVLEWVYHIREKEFLDCTFYNEKQYKVEYSNNKFQDNLFHNCQWCVTLQKVPFKNNKFTGTTTERGYLRSEFWPSSSLYGCELSDNSFENILFNQTKFLSCRLDYTTFYKCKFETCEFDNCVFDEVDFDMCEFTSCIFRNCEIKQECDIYNNKFINCYFFTTEISNEQTSDNIFIHSNMPLLQAYYLYRADNDIYVEQPLDDNSCDSIKYIKVFDSKYNSIQ